MNTISKRQFSLLLFIATITFKITMLPAQMFNHVGKSAWLSMLIFIAAEAVIYAVLYKFICLRGSENLEKSKMKKYYYAVLAVLYIFFIFKNILFYAVTVRFIVNSMLENATIVTALIICLVPTIFIAVKGITGLARMSEIIILPLCFLIIETLSMAETNIDIMRCLPVLDRGAANFAEHSSRYFFWFGDFLPFIFLTFSDKKKKLVGFFSTFGFVVVLAFFIMSIAIFGPLSKLINMPFVEIAELGFFSKVFGRTDWLCAIMWLMIALVQTAVLVWSMIEIMGRLSKNRTFSVIASVLPVIIVAMLTPNPETYVRFVQEEVKYFAAVCCYIVPFILLFMAKKAHKQAEAQAAVEGEANELL